MFANAFSGKKILITGHTGFKGTWLALWLKQLGADVVGASIGVPTTPSHFSEIHLNDHIRDHVIDVRDATAVRDLIVKYQPDFVFHLAAQALVKNSYEFPLDTMATNAMGSANLLNALRFLTKKVVVVMITSDKAYDNVEWVWGYRETDRLGGKDPYSGSKGMAELAIRSFIESYFSSHDSNIRLAISRAGNVIGGGDWAADRIVPDCMRAWSRSMVVDIRSPHATRPWQHVLEPLSGYLALAAALSSNDKLHGEAYNFGPSAHQDHSVSDLIEEMKKHWDLVQWNDISETQSHLHEAWLLKLNCDKALFDLGWLPTLNFEETVQMTVEWYKSFYQQERFDMLEYSANQIAEYIELAKKRKISWIL